jgi:hypothetical protein
MTMPYSAAHLLHPSGGLVYHLRAWRHGNGLWRPFHRQVTDWLDAWRPEARELVLIGPSAGYALPRALPARFARVVAHEPDPVARYLLRRRFPDPRIQPAGPVEDLTVLARTHPDAAFLFCNLLGQDWMARAPEAWHAELGAAMAGREWASYHEIASTTRPPVQAGPLIEAACPAFETLLARFWQGPELLVEDHGTLGLFPELPREYFVWNFIPGRFHLVEWLRG